MLHALPKDFPELVYVGIPAKDNNVLFTLGQECTNPGRQVAVVTILYSSA